MARVTGAAAPSTRGLVEPDAQALRVQVDVQGQLLDRALDVGDTMLDEQSVLGMALGVR